MELLLIVLPLIGTLAIVGEYCVNREYKDAFNKLKNT